MNRWNDWWRIMLSRSASASSLRSCPGGSWSPSTWQQTWQQQTSRQIWKTSWLTSLTCPPWQAGHSCGCSWQAQVASCWTCSPSPCFVYLCSPSPCLPWQCWHSSWSWCFPCPSCSPGSRAWSQLGRPARHRLISMKPQLVGALQWSVCWLVRWLEALTLCFESSLQSLDVWCWFPGPCSSLTQ